MLKLLTLNRQFLAGTNENKTLKIKSFLPFSFTITKICDSINPFYSQVLNVI